jgi:hypothetical protein
MKKHLLFAALLISGGAFAQTCTVDSQFASEGPGLYPEGPLGPSCELIAAKTIVSLTDTAMANPLAAGTTFLMYISQMKVLGVTGLPAGLELHTDVEVDPANGDWGIWINSGPSHNQTSALGCAYVAGTQVDWDAAIGGGPLNDGVYPLEFSIDAKTDGSDNATINLFIPSGTWVSAIDPGMGGGPLTLFDTLVVSASYLDLTATISGPASVAPATQYTYSVAAQAGASYNWTVTNGTIVSGQGTNSVEVTWTGSGNVEVDVTDASCSGNDAMAVTSTATGIDEAAGINASIYPNPSNGIFTLQLDATEALNIRIMDVSGKMVRAERLAGANLYTIDMTAAEAGVYVMEIETATGRTFKRLVKN